MNAGERFSLTPRGKKTSGSMSKNSILCNKAFSSEKMFSLGSVCLEEQGQDGLLELLAGYSGK